MKLNLPTLLTLGRIAILPVGVLFYLLPITYSHQLAAMCVAIVGVTDYFDGYLARIRNEITNFGTFLDPIADKLLVASVILILTSKEVITDWETIPALIILLREIAVSGLREYLAGLKVSVPVTKIGKLKTTIQLIALALLILSESQLDLLPIMLIGNIALWLAGLLTLYTGFDYLKSGLKHF